MKHSIRRILLLNLLVIVFIIILLSDVAIYYLGAQDVDALTDQNLVHNVFTIESFLSGIKDNQFALAKIQESLANLKKQQTEALKLSGNDPSYNYKSLSEYPIEYQLWDTNGRLLLHSQDAPNVRLSTQTSTGFSATTINDTPWRVFTLVHADKNYILIVGSRNALQTWLKRAIAKDGLYIMLLTFPILGILIWLILSHGLSSLGRVSNEIAHRAPNFLESVDTTQVPEEIFGLIDELNKLLFRLKQTIEREQRFASDAAHELRTPLAAIRTQAQVALKNVQDPFIVAALEKVMAGVERSTHVVAQLLTLSKLVPESPLGNQSNVDIIKIAQDIISEIIPIALEKDVDIGLVAEKQNITLLANGITIGILLRNLIDNAIRYIHKGGNVTIYILENSTNVIIRVVDNGPGIPPKLRARVFERFFRVLGTQTQGSGLGLAIVQQIAALHHAQVILGEPEEGTGLQVDVVFPKYH